MKYNIVDSLNKRSEKDNYCWKKTSRKNHLARKQMAKLLKLFGQEVNSNFENYNEPNIWRKFELLSCSLCGTLEFASYFIKMKLLDTEW